MSLRGAQRGSNLISRMRRLVEVMRRLRLIFLPDPTLAFPALVPCEDTGRRLESIFSVIPRLTWNPVSYTNTKIASYEKGADEDICRPQNGGPPSHSDNLIHIFSCAFSSSPSLLGGKVLSCILGSGSSNWIIIALEP